MIKLNPTIKILIGPPCSGKTFYVNKNALSNEVVISRDAIIMELHPDLNYTEAYRVCNQKDVNRIFKERFDECVANGVSIIIDKTNLTSKTRKKLLAKVSVDYTKIAILFDWDKKILLERNIKRNIEEGKFISDKVFEDMINSFVPIKDIEGFDKVISLKISK